MVQRILGTIEFAFQKMYEELFRYSEDENIERHHCAVKVLLLRGMSIHKRCDEKEYAFCPYLTLMAAMDSAEALSSCIYMGWSTNDKMT